MTDIESLEAQNKALGDLVHKRGNTIAFLRDELKFALRHAKLIRDQDQGCGGTLTKDQIEYNRSILNSEIINRLEETLR